jgi:sugar lactone lactonase YvrE
MSRQPRIIADGFLFPEGPRWHGDSLWFSDCHAGSVVNIDVDGTLLERFDVPGKPSGLGWLPDGDMLIVSIDEIRLYRRHPDKRLTIHAELSPFHDFFSNDMVVDGRGNAYVGAVGFRMGSEPIRTTVLALVRPDGSTAVAADEMLTPNGTVVTPDGKRLIVAESQRRCLTSFAIAEDGTLHDRSLFAQLDQADIPDGICLDAEGCIWVASPFTSSVLRVDQTAGVVDRITLERRPYACALGGPGRGTLFICCAPDHDHEVTKHAKQGAIAALETDVPGAGYP